MSSKPGSTIYLDKLSATAAMSIMATRVLPLLFRRRGSLVINYFSSSKWGQRWIAAFGRFTFVQTQEMEYSLADVRNEYGACPQIQVLLEHALEVSQQFSQTVLESHPMVRRMRKLFTGERLPIVLRQNAASQIGMTLLKINVVRWFHRNQSNQATTDPTFFVAKSPLFPFIASYAVKHGVQLGSYREAPTINSRRIRVSGAFALRSAFRLPSQIIRRGQRKLRANGTGTAAPSPVRTRVSGPTVLVPLDGNGISLDPRQNSDLFWIPSSSLNRNQFLAYSFRGDFALDEARIQSLKNEDIRCVARTKEGAASPNAPRWSPSPKMFKTYFGLWIQVMKAAALSFISSPRITLWILPRLLNMVRDYAVWYDFDQT